MSTYGNTYLKKYKRIEIDGKILPSPSGVNTTRDLIQSANTRRTSNAKMVGTVIDVKATHKFSFPPGLKPSEIEMIENIVCEPAANGKIKFEHTLKLTNEFSKEETLKVYFGNYSTDQYGFIGGKMLLQSLSFEAVEI